MGDSKGTVPAHVANEVRCNVKVKQAQNVHAHSAHKRYEQDCDNEFQSDFVGEFSRETQEVLASVQAEHGLITAGQLYALVQEDANKVVLELTGPELALVALNAVGHKVVVRPYAFRSFEKVKKQNDDGEWVDCVQDVRTPFKCRSVTVPTGNGFGIKFKYNGSRQSIVVC